jgi:prolyl-tRNA synthetase
MGTVVEALSDDKGIIWPETIAPFAVHLLLLGEDEIVSTEAEKIYDTLKQNNIEVLFDDRKDVSPGEKFADADLLGMPWRVVISARSLKDCFNSSTVKSPLIVRVLPAMVGSRLSMRESRLEFVFEFGEEF